MKIVRGFALGLAVLAMVILSGAYAVASNPATVGDFLSAYAKALKIEMPANTSGRPSSRVIANGWRPDPSLRHS